MKNITVSLPDDVHRRARLKAAERGVSLSSMVRDFFVHLGQEESEFDRLLRLQTEVVAGIHDFRASDRVSREEAHGRHPVR